MCRARCRQANRSFHSFGSRSSGVEGLCAGGDTWLPGRRADGFELCQRVTLLGNVLIVRNHQNRVSLFHSLQEFDDDHHHLIV